MFLHRKVDFLLLCHILQDLVEILTPLNKATDIVQTRISWVPSARYVLPCVRRLKHHIYKLWYLNIIQTLHKYWWTQRTRMPLYKENKIYITALIVDPRFKLRWCLRDETKEFRDMVVSAVDKILVSESSSIVDTVITMLFLHNKN